jgi:fumarate reductase subunit D
MPSSSWHLGLPDSFQSGAVTYNLLLVTAALGTYFYYITVPYRFFTSLHRIQHSINTTTIDPRILCHYTTEWCVIIA